jgi:hypothetical protein
VISDKLHPSRRFFLTGREKEEIEKKREREKVKFLKIIT